MKKTTKKVKKVVEKVAKKPVPEGKPKDGWLAARKCKFARNGSTLAKIVGFLTERKDPKFTRAELAATAGLSKKLLGLPLNALVRNGIVKRTALGCYTLNSKAALPTIV